MFCSHVAIQGASPKAIMELARHTSLGVTQRYMHLSPDHRRDAIDLLDVRPGQRISSLKQVSLHFPDESAAPVGHHLGTKGADEPITD